MLSSEELQIGQDWFAGSNFSDTERRQILGQDPDQHSAKQTDFNWIGSYLYYQIGLYEEELAEWFRSSMKGLDDRTPLSVWQEEDGFEQVLREAEVWREQLAEDLGDDVEANVAAEL